MAAPDLIGLSEPLFDSKDAKLDIVFVHGLGGDRESTWTHAASKTFWPRDLLPKACPQARILTFGYSSDWVQFFGPERISQTSIDDHSVALLGDLSGLRNRTATSDRPIIFVAHSLGGLITANALSASNNMQAQSIIKATRGILFFGTPFAGSNKARWGEVAEKILKYFTNTNTKNIKALKTDSEALASINNNFAKFLMRRAKSPDEHPVEVACFFEELSLKVGMTSVGRIVTQESAVIVGIDPIGIEADHISMCKFQDEERRGYIRASEMLQGWIKELDETPKQDTGKYSIYQGNVTFGQIQGNRGVVTGNIYTPARNGVNLVGSNNYYGPFGKGDANPIDFLDSERH